jgi:hypothetical protein
MRHIEIHTIETEVDSISAFNTGLIPDVFYTGICSGCGDEVGVLEESFEPYVVVLEDEDEWHLCLYCAESVTDPEEAAFVDPNGDDDLEHFTL